VLGRLLCDRLRLDPSHPRLLELGAHRRGPFADARQLPLQQFDPLGLFDRRPRGWLERAPRSELRIGRRVPLGDHSDSLFELIVTCDLSACPAEFTRCVGQPLSDLDEPVERGEPVQLLPLLDVQVLALCNKLG
jgi:hypothetical protein